jgi:hypothetical protein
MSVHRSASSTAKISDFGFSYVNLIFEFYTKNYGEN